MKRIIILTVCMLMLFSITVFADPSIYKEPKNVGNIVTPMYVPCPLPSHNWIYQSTDRWNETSSHDLYINVYDDYGNIIDRLLVGYCIDTTEKAKAYYSCIACPATTYSISSRFLGHDPHYY